MKLRSLIASLMLFVAVGIVPCKAVDIIGHYIVLVINADIPLLHGRHTHNTGLFCADIDTMLFKHIAVSALGLAAICAVVVLGEANGIKFHAGRTHAACARLAPFKGAACKSG